MFIYYVYQYLREDGTPYYIGKGKGIRAWNHSKKERIHLPKDKSRIQLIAQKLSEFEAHILEKDLISYFGRLDLGTGILQNRTNGGEGASGAIRSEETKTKMSLSKLGIKKPPRTEEHSAKLSVSCKGRIPWNKGIKMPAPTEEARLNMSLAKKGKPAKNKGVPHTEEYKLAHSVKMTEWWKKRKESK